jgi:hypothetical protein
VLKVRRKPRDAHEPVAQNGTLDMIRYAARIASSLTGDRFRRMQEITSATFSVPIRPTSWRLWLTMLVCDVHAIRGKPKIRDRDMRLHGFRVSTRNLPTLWSFICSWHACKCGWDQRKKSAPNFVPTHQPQMVLQFPIWNEIEA